ncbi:MAG: hypothetical protein HFI38_00560 [Lachnospiraceae bacterium]|jgi:RNA polymerase primary sigma factor|nr:hypothetical protein [Lachnospiraceae bacterium]
MDEQLRLKEALGALLMLAEASERRLTRSQVEAACEGIGLTARQMEMVLAYLQMNHVTIEGFVASQPDRALFQDQKDQAASGEKTGTESVHYKAYLKELESVRPCHEAEAAELAEAMLAGDLQAKQRLIEGNLHRVIQVSKEYLGRGVLAADLVQEGNMALTTAMDTYERGENLTIHLLTAIENAMAEAIREQTGADDVGHFLAADANALLKATEVLAGELGREATADELAAHLHISKKRVEALVKMSLDAMNLSDD